MFVETPRLHESSVEGWVTVTVAAVDHGSPAAGEEQAYTVGRHRTANGALLLASYVRLRTIE